MKGFASFLSGAVLGSLVGAAMALLLTPESGSDLRDQIQERADRIQNEVKKAAENRRSELEQQLALLRAPRSADQA